MSSLYKYLKEREKLVDISETIPYPYVGVRKVFRIGSPVLPYGDNKSIENQFRYQLHKAELELKRDGILLLDNIALRNIRRYVMTNLEIIDLGDKKYMVEARMGYIPDNSRESTNRR